jgi:hypothetical protein
MELAESMRENSEYIILSSTPTLNDESSPELKIRHASR